MDRTKTIRKLVISLTAGVLGMLAVNVFSAVYPEKVEHFIETEKEPDGVVGNAVSRVLFFGYSGRFRKNGYKDFLLACACSQLVII